MGLKDRTRVERLVREQQPVTADTALRLGKVFGTSADLWLNMQAQHDLSKAALEAKDQLAAISGWTRRRRCRGRATMWIDPLGRESGRSGDRLSA